MTFVLALVLICLPCTPAPPGKSTISSSDAMTSLAFNLKYLPVAVAEDNGAGNKGVGSSIEGRVQVLLNTSYTARNCQLYSTKGELGSASAFHSMISNGWGNDCIYISYQQHTSGTKLHMVFAHNKAQCCNACVATKGCVGATFQTSSMDHSGGFGPQTWEGFGIHITDVTGAKTTGGIMVSQLESDFKARLGDHSTFDQFMDYSVTFFTYNLQSYVDAFKRDGVPYFLGKWRCSFNTTSMNILNGLAVPTQHLTTDSWYSLIFLVESSHYVIELVSAIKPKGKKFWPQMEQRMSSAHCKKFKLYEDHPAHVLWISSVNRASSDMNRIDDIYTRLFRARSTHKVDREGLVRRCYTYNGVSRLELPPGPGASGLDEDICFTSRTVDAKKDKILSVKGFEEMLWAEHAATIGSNADSEIDKYTDNHYSMPVPPSGLRALAKEFISNDPYPITASTRLAYACKQNYIIDPTGWSIQPIGIASWPKCSAWPLAAKVFGVMGIFTTIGMMTAPYSTFKRIVLEQSVSQFQVLPYILSLLQCSMWIIFGLATPGAVELIIMNGLGAGIQLLWCCLYFRFSPAKCSIGLQLFAVFMFVGAMDAIDIYWAPLSTSSLDERVNSEFLGAVADIICVLMYAAPLGVAKQVVRSRSVEFMPLPLTAFGLINASVQFAYGFALGDLFIMIPNIGGIGLGIGQLVLYSVFCGHRFSRQLTPEGLVPTDCSSELSSELPRAILETQKTPDPLAFLSMSRY